MLNGGGLVVVVITGAEIAIIVHRVQVLIRQRLHVFDNFQFLHAFGG